MIQCIFKPEENVKWMPYLKRSVSNTCRIKTRKYLIATHVVYFQMVFGFGFTDGQKCGKNFSVLTMGFNMATKEKIKDTAWSLLNFNPNNDIEVTCYYGQIV